MSSWTTSNEVKIIPHAVDSYISKVMRRPSDVDKYSVREQAKKDIYFIYNNPEQVYMEKEDMPPIYIGKGAGIVVDPHDEEEYSAVVKTAYNSYTFLEKGGR